MSICVKGKARSKIRWKVCTLKASNGGHRSSLQRWSSATQNQSLTCHTSPYGDTFWCAAPRARRGLMEGAANQLQSDSPSNYCYAVGWWRPSSADTGQRPEGAVTSAFIMRQEQQNQDQREVDLEGENWLRFQILILKEFYISCRNISIPRVGMMLDNFMLEFFLAKQQQ